MPQGPNPDLPPLPASFEATRLSLHRVAEQVVAPARKPDNEISLRATEGGFGTPRFDFEDAERQVKVVGAELAYVRDGDESRAGLGSLSQAGELVAGLLPTDAALDDAPLDVDPAAADALAAWFALGEQALAELVTEAGPGDAPTDPLLWPEHFDLAIESGSEADGRRANYGFSPGDEEHPEPYLYVGPWRGKVDGALWNATGFDGAEMGYAELHAAADPLAAALEFCRARRQELDSTEDPDE